MCRSSLQLANQIHFKWLNPTGFMNAWIFKHPKKVANSKDMSALRDLSCIFIVVFVLVESTLYNSGPYFDISSKIFLVLDHRSHHCHFLVYQFNKFQY